MKAFVFSISENDPSTNPSVIIYLSHTHALPFFNLEENTDTLKVQLPTCGHLVGAHCQSSELAAEVCMQPTPALPDSLCPWQGGFLFLWCRGDKEWQEVPPRRLCHPWGRKRAFLLQGHYCRWKAPTYGPQPRKESSTMTPVLSTH